jgi:protein involved in polysaccharide export with SLBB domain
MHKTGIAAALSLLVSLAALAQSPASTGSVSAASSGSGNAQVSSLDVQRTRLAISTPDYPVTPSDLYRLTYKSSNTVISTLDISVGSDYRIDLGLFGQIDAKDMRFVDLRVKVETLVASIYARSYPSLAIITVGTFNLNVGGDFLGTSWVDAWGLSRLGEVTADSALKGASRRNIFLNRVDGTTKSYDALLAQRALVPMEDPFVKPGDRITLFLAGSIVRLEGEVKHPGDYELLPNEGLSELIEIFGGGPTLLADLSRVSVNRMAATGLVLDYVSLPGGYQGFRNLTGTISVKVPSLADSRSYVWFEGAVLSNQPEAQTAQGAQVTAGTGTGTAAPAANPATTRLTVPILPGQKLSDVLLTVRDRFSPMGDLSSAILLRAGAKPTTLDLLEIMSTGSPSADIVLKANDRIVIPSLISTVYISGAVAFPGSFPYQPDMPATYYLGLAGGRDPLRSADGALSVTSLDGVSRDPKAIVEPGDRIYLTTDVADVTVSGSVSTPGTFPFRENSSARYYLNRAGGIDPDRNLDGSFTITDASGNPVAKDAILKGGENIYVPTNNIGLTVSGAVYAPGLFPFREGAPIEYYIGRAGGINPDLNAFGSFRLTDRTGKWLDPKKTVLRGGERIYVLSDDFSYNLLKYLPVITGLITTGISTYLFIKTLIPAP